MLARVAAAIGAATVVAGAAIYVGKAVDHQWFWRGDAYQKLTSLEAGYTQRAFEARLGAPVFSRAVPVRPYSYFRRNWPFPAVAVTSYVTPSIHATYRESTFRGRGYWVQTISDPDGTVVEYVVTACDKQFKPTFKTTASSLPKLTLGETTLADIPSELPAYANSGTASGWAFLYEFLIGGTAELNKSYLWGVNDICPNSRRDFNKYFDSGLGKVLDHNGGYPGFGPLTASQKSGLRQVRQEAVINTYGETAPGSEFVRVGRDRTFPTGSAPFVHTGPDRLLIQTAP